MVKENDPVSILYSSVTKLPPVSFSSALAFNNKKESITGEVNRIMESNPDLKNLIGHNSFSMMYDNHMNHAEFMSNVFKLNDFTLMVKIVLWAYRIYSVQGFSHEYFTLQLKAWSKAVDRYLEPENSREINIVYEWIIDNHQLLTEASQEDSCNTEECTSNWEKLKTPFLNSLIEGNSSQSLKIASDNVLTSTDLSDFYLKVIQPSMYKIGLLWEKGNISVAQEHLASAIVARVMSSLYPRFSVIDYSKEKAIVTAAPNEYHEIGPRMVADLLEIDGWDVDYIGANVPARDIIDISLDKKPMFIAISVGMPFNLVRAQELIEAIRKQPVLDETKIMLGGYSLATHPRIRELMIVDSCGGSAQEAVKIASEWWNNT